MNRTLPPTWTGDELAAGAPPAGDYGAAPLRVADTAALHQAAGPGVNDHLWGVDSTPGSCTDVAGGATSPIGVAAGGRPPISDGQSHRHLPLTASTPSWPQLLHLVARRRAPWWMVVMATLCSIPELVVDSIADDGLVNDLTTRIFWLCLMVLAIAVVATQVLMRVGG